MTIISQTHKLIFLHLPKCGGSSVEVAYQPHARWCDLVIGSTEEGEALQGIMKKLHGLHKHSTAEQLARIAPEVWSTSWKFTTVRHPCGIYESYYRWISKIFGNNTQGLSLSEFKKQVLQGSVKAPFAQWPISRSFAATVDFDEFVLDFSQHSDLARMKKRLSVDGQLAVDAFYKMEDLDSLWRDLAERVPGLSHSHANKGLRVATPWSPESLSTVLDLHAEDLDAFGYAAEWPSTH